MKRILKVQVEPADDSICCGIYDKAIGGAVFSTGKNLEELKDKFSKALRSHIECCIEDGDDIPWDVASGDYIIEYIMN